MRTRSISKYHFQHRYMIFFEITRDSYASASLSLSLSLSHLLSKFANSLEPEYLRRLAKPNQGQTGIPRIIHVSKRPTFRPMPRKYIIEPWHEISNNVVCGTSKASDQPTHMHNLIRAFDMRFPTMWYVGPAKPQISLRICTVWSEPLLVAWIFYECWATDWTSNWVYNLKGGCTDRLRLHSSKCHIVSRLNLWYDAYDTLGTFISQRKGKIKTSTTNLVFRACIAPFHARVHWNCFFPMQTHEKGHMFCVLSPFSCAKATACYPSLKTTTTCGLIVGFFDLKHVREPLPCPFVCGWYY